MRSNTTQEHPFEQARPTVVPTPELRAAVASIDWALLRLQKATLQGVSDHASPLSILRADTLGLINFIDRIQDAAIGDGIATAQQVNGLPPEPEPEPEPSPVPPPQYKSRCF